MKLKLLTFILVLINGISFAQLSKIDSLLNLLNDSKEDTFQIINSSKISKILFEKNKYDSSIIYAEKALSLSRKLNYSKGEATALSHLGSAHQYKGNLDSALQYFSESLKINETLNNIVASSSTYSDIGAIYYMKGDYEKTQYYFFKTLDAKKLLNDTLGIAYIYNNIAIFYNSQGKSKEAIDYFLLSAKLKEKKNLIKSLGNTYNNIGLTYEYLGDFSASLSYYNKALKIFEEFKNKKGLAGVYDNIGGIYKLLGNYTEALEYHLMGLKLGEEIGDKLFIDGCLNNISIFHLKNNDFEKALEYQLKSLKMSEETGNLPSIINDYTNLGVIYNDLGQRLNHKDSLQQQKEYYKKAIQYQLDALEIINKIDDKRKLPMQYVNVAIAYLSNKDYASAIKYSHKTLEEIKINPYHNCYNLATRTLYLTYSQTKKIDSSYKYISLLKSNTLKELDANYFSLSENEKTMFFSSVEKNFGYYFDFSYYNSPQYPYLSDTAYNLALINKSFALKSSTMMRQSILKSGDSSLIKEFENWLELKEELSQIYTQTDKSRELEKLVNDVEKNLILKSKDFGDFEKVRSLDWKQVQSNLKPAEAAIEFIHFESELDSLKNTKYVAYLITKKSKHPIMIPICDEKELIEIIKKSQANNQDYVNSVYGTNSEFNISLYEKIWKPIDKHLKGIKTIYYSPTGLLHKISFSAISKKRNLYLCDSYNMTPIGSTGNIGSSETAFLNKDNSYLILGGINYDSKNSAEKIWSYLPATLSEAEKITQHLANKNYVVELFSDTKATEENLKNKIITSNIVHIATHGFFYPNPESEIDKNVTQTEIKFRGTTHYANLTFVKNKNPLMRSGIVLANANDVWDRDPLKEGEDGILTALEVSGLNLTQTKLVVLSACETGLGDIKGSEGVYGLQRAFKMAGVKYLIMSLWQVPDKETEEFMVTLYDELDKSENIRMAFSNTQKIMRAKYDPYFWGAFVLIE